MLFFSNLGPDSIKVIIDNQNQYNEEDPCYFLKDIADFNLKIHLGKKCLKNKSPEFVYALGARSISVNDIKCGVRNITNQHSISASDICWSKTEEKLGKFIQSLFTNNRFLCLMKWCCNEALSKNMPTYIGIIWKVITHVGFALQKFGNLNKQDEIIFYPKFKANYLYQPIRSLFTQYNIITWFYHFLSQVWLQHLE